MTVIPRIGVRAVSAANMITAFFAICLIAGGASAGASHEGYSYPVPAEHHQEEIDVRISTPDFVAPPSAQHVAPAVVVTPSKEYSPATSYQSISIAPVEHRQLPPAPEKIVLKPLPLPTNYDYPQPAVQSTKTTQISAQKKLPVQQYEVPAAIPVHVEGASPQAKYLPSVAEKQEVHHHQTIATAPQPSKLYLPPVEFPTALGELPLREDSSPGLKYLAPNHQPAAVSAPVPLQYVQSPPSATYQTQPQLAPSAQYVQQSTISGPQTVFTQVPSPGQHLHPSEGAAAVPAVQPIPSRQYLPAVTTEGRFAAVPTLQTGPQYFPVSTGGAPIVSAPSQEYLAEAQYSVSAPQLVAYVEQPSRQYLPPTPQVLSAIPLGQQYPFPTAGYETPFEQASRGYHPVPAASAISVPELLALVDQPSRGYLPIPAAPQAQYTVAAPEFAEQPSRGYLPASAAPQVLPTIATEVHYTVPAPELVAQPSREYLPASTAPQTFPASQYSISAHVEQPISEPSRGYLPVPVAPQVLPTIATEAHYTAQPSRQYLPASTAPQTFPVSQYSISAHVEQPIVSEPSRGYLPVPVAPQAHYTAPASELVAHVEQPSRQYLPAGTAHQALPAISYATQYSSSAHVEQPIVSEPSRRYLPVPAATSTAAHSESAAHYAQTAEIVHSIFGGSPSGEYVRSAPIRSVEITLPTEVQNGYTYQTAKSLRNK